KDSYSFDLDAAGLDISYKKHYETYCRIFDRCGLQYMAVEAHSGAMGGSQSHEFVVNTNAGEDFVVSCPNCRYAANLEKATSRLEPVEDYAATGTGEPELVHTPGLKTVEEVANYLGVSPKNKMKTLALMATETKSGAEKPHEVPVILFLRGDHTLNEAKLSTALAGAQFRPMHLEEIQAVFGAPAGFLGPIGSEVRQYKGIKARVLVDRALLGRKNLIAGANQEDYHLRNVTPERDFTVSEWADLRSVGEGEGCPNCGATLKIAKAMEIGHIFKLGYKYSESMGARVLDQAGKEVAPIMGSYGIGIERILSSACEQSNDKDGFWLPRSIAPFDVVVTSTNVADSAIRSAGEDMAVKLTSAGFDVLLDDRDDRAGVKFKDADLVGIPYRVNVGKKVTEGKVELVQRSTRESVDASMAEIPEKLRQITQ